MKRVEIFWQDTVTHSELRLLEDARNLPPVVMQVMGYILEETPNTIVILGQVEVTEREDRVCADVHIIPRGCILSMKEIPNDS